MQTVALGTHPFPLVTHPVRNASHASLVAASPLSKHVLSMQALEVAVPYLHLLVAAAAVMVSHEVDVPDIKVHDVLANTHPLPVVLQPVKNSSHSLSVYAVVL